MIGATVAVLSLLLAHCASLDVYLVPHSHDDTGGHDVFPLRLLMQ
jgi:hypothetical protein